MHTNRSFGILIHVLLLTAIGNTVYSQQAPKKESHSPTILILSDIHLDDSLAYTPHGSMDYTDHRLWSSAKQEIQNITAGRALVPKPDLILFLGDLPRHPGDPENTRITRRNATHALHDLRSIAREAHIPLVFVPGNNDSWAGHYKPFSGELFSNDTVCAGCWPVAGLPKGIADDKAPRIVSDDGFDCYSVYPLGNRGSKNLRIIAWNSNIFSLQYVERNSASTAALAAKRIAWLKQELKDARDHNDAVLIAMHIPPGLDAYESADSWNPSLKAGSRNGSVQNVFLSLMQEYQSSIIGLVSGHSHMDGLRRLYDASGQMSVFCLSAPAIDPEYGNNPGMKLLTLHPATYEIDNAVTLYQDLHKDSIVKDWGTEKFDLRSVIHCPPGTALKTYLPRLNDPTLAGYLYQIYNVKGREDRNILIRVARSIDVYMQ